MTSKVVFLNSCIVDTPYSLALYLLSCNEEEIERTLFFVGDAMPIPIVKNLKDVVCFKRPNHTSYLNGFLFRIKCLRFRNLLKKSKVYAQDHLFFSPGLLDNIPYTLIEDAPNFFSIASNFDHFRPFYKDTLTGRIRNFLIGRIYGKQLGCNEYCINRLVTSGEFNNQFLDGKRYEICNLSQLWSDSDDEKKAIICSIFNLKDLTEMDKKVIVFTQPFITDCNITEEEQINIYKPTIEEYGEQNIVIKSHPRDYVEYQHYFPQIAVLKTNAPMQLLSAMGVKYDIAITVCSSAISSLPPTTQIKWLGTDVHPKIRATYGIIKKPSSLK